MNVQRPPGLETDEADTPASASASVSETQEISPRKDSEETVSDQDDDRAFDWGRDTLIQEQKPLAIYRGGTGCIVFRQYEPPGAPRWECEDIYILVDQVHLPQIISKLLRMQRGEE